jgi:catechol 2,3-dioxygenase-like lactoylglutathione lyase family enzyme
VFDHLTIRAGDRAASARFYNTVLAPLGVDETYRIGTFSEWHDFSLAAAEHPDAVTRRLHVAFVSPTREQVDLFWKAGTGAGYDDDGPPGPRTHYRDDYYGAFLLDPDGNSAEAVYHGDLRRHGIIDHVWIRVADLGAAQDFYATIAPHAGLTIRNADSGRVTVAGDSGSFSLVEGEATKNLHMAFPTEDDGLVQRFHAAAVDAGYRSNGEPGERPRYHPGYYAAYVFDPDGNNIEVVNHHRRDTE